MTGDQPRQRTNQFTFRIAFEIPVDDFLRHHYVDVVVRETRKEEVEDQIDQKPYVADQILRRTSSSAKPKQNRTPIILITTLAVIVRLISNGAPLS